MKLAKILVLLLALAGLACGIFEQPTPKFGREYNEERTKVGVPVIPADWELHTVRDGECAWVNPERTAKRDARIPGHWSKYVNYRTGELLYETDIYFGREDYVTEEGTFRERLRVTYYYTADPYDHKERLGWSVELSNSTSTGTEITLEEADAILRNWGIDRLSAEPKSSTPAPFFEPPGE